MLERQWYKKPIDQLLQAMTDAENHVRLSAVSAIPLFVVKLRARTKPTHDNDDDDDGEDVEKDLEMEILNGIEALLVDLSPYVCLAAAAVLFSLGIFYLIYPTTAWDQTLFSFYLLFNLFTAGVSRTGIPDRFCPLSISRKFSN